MARKANYLYEEDLDVFVDMIENGNFDKEEFTCDKKKNSATEQNFLLKANMTVGPPVFQNNEFIYIFA